jgi:uncharacterized protein YcfJ
VQQRFSPRVQYQPVVKQKIRRKTMMMTLFAAAAASSMTPAASAAVPFDISSAGAYSQVSDYHSRERAYNRGYDDGRRDGERLSRNSRVWRGDDGRTYCRRKNGTTGLVIGAAGGALLGREIAGRGDRTLGLILGAAGGGLLGREIDKGSYRCR